jgi:hypothetical protein
MTRRTCLLKTGIHLLKAAFVKGYMLPNKPAGPDVYRHGPESQMYGTIYYKKALRFSKGFYMRF